MDAPIVGRESELQRMHAIVRSAARGRGHTVIIRGEAGIGKTRLAEEFASSAAAGGLSVSRGQALNDPGMPVLWPWRRALGPIGGCSALIDDAGPVELASAAEATDARFRLLSRIGDQVANTVSTPGRMLILEDLHWADELSTALLRHLVAAVADRPVVLVLTVRAPQTEPLPGHVERTLTELAALPATDVLPLAGLSVQQVEQWFCALPGVEPSTAHRMAAAITDQEGANPLHVRLLGEELQRHPTAELSSLDAVDLRRLLSHQLAPLPAEVQQTLRAAAMINDRITAQLLTRMAERDQQQLANDLDTAVRAGILRRVPGEDDCTFVHVLVRDAVRAELTPAERRRLHFRAATAIADSPQAERFAGLIARHWLLSGRPEADHEALAWLRRAATAAGARQDLDTALDAWDQALAVAERLGLYEVCGWLHIDRARARYCAGMIDESLTDSEVAVELAHQVDAPEMAARAALVVAGIGGIEASARIETLCDAALALMPQPPTEPNDRHLTSRMLSRRAQVLVVRDLERARDLSASALAMVDDGCADAVLDAVAARHLALSTATHLPERTALAQRAIAVGTAAHQPLGGAWGHIWMFDAAMQSGDLDRADREIAALQRIVNAGQWPMARWHLLRERACRAGLTGDFAIAERLAAEAGALAGDLADRTIGHLHDLVRVELEILQGRADEEIATALLETSGRMPAADPAPALMAVRLLLRAGCPDAARDAYRPWRPMIMDPDSRSTDRPAHQLRLLWHADIAVGLEDEEAADAAYRQLLDEPGPYCGDGSGMIISTGALARTAAELALATGRTAEAISWHRQGISQNLHIGATPFVALGRLGLAEALVASGEDAAGEVGRLVSQASVTFERLQMPEMLARARRLQTTVSDESVIRLTPREAEIAALVADARSNRDIARRLVLSERTVESHVRNALAKVGAQTRTGLAAWVLRQPQDRPPDRSPSAHVPH